MDEFAPPEAPLQAPAPPLTPRDRHALAYVRATNAPKIVLGGAVGGTALVVLGVSALRDASLSAHVAVYVAWLVAGAAAIGAGGVGIATAAESPDRIRATLWIERLFWWAWTAAALLSGAGLLASVLTG